MDRKDFLLLVLYAAEGQPLTPVQLQKSLFLIWKADLPEVPKAFYSFDPYHYGPFDVNIYHDADFLQQQNMAIRSPSTNGTWTNTIITPDGQTRAGTLESGLSAESRRYIREVVTWVRSQSFKQLTRSIYDKYPEFRQNSVFQDVH